MNQPLVSILLPAYNAELFIISALESILNQTYSNLEIIVINDGSTDNTEQIINTLTDDRIKLINNDNNLGLIKTLNKGIDFCNGKYIARMDADDISYPTRIEKQVSTMEENPSVGICGTWFETYTNNEPTGHSKYPANNDEIQINQLHKISLCHGTAIFKKQVLLDNKFDSDFAHAEDFELWSRIKNCTKMKNIQEVLYRVNRHGENVSIKNQAIQENNTIRIIQKQLNEISGEEITKEQVRLYVQLCYSNFNLSTLEIEQIGQLNKILKNGSKHMNLVDPASFNLYINNKWNHLCLNNIKSKKASYTLWKKYRLNSNDILMKLKFLVKVILS